MKVLIVRAAVDARRTAARISAAGHEAIVAPVLDIRRLDFSLPSGAFDAVVATSAHAFSASEGLSSVRGLPLFVVGARATDAARSAGFGTPRIVAATAEELAAATAGVLREGARVLYLAGRDRKPDLEAALGGRCTLTIVETYVSEPAETLPAAAVDALKAGEGAVLHYSQRSAAIFLDLAQRGGFGPQLRALGHIAISADAARPLVAAGLAVAVAAQPNEDSMIEELARIT